MEIVSDAPAFREVFIMFSLMFLVTRVKPAVGDGERPFLEIAGGAGSYGYRLVANDPDNRATRSCEHLRSSFQRAFT